MGVPRSLYLALLLLLAASGFAQTTQHTAPEAKSEEAAAPDAETLSPADVAKRDELMKPGLELLKKGDMNGAYVALWPARKEYPKDLRVLRYSAEAAFYSGHNAEALDLFNRALALHPNQPWPLRLAHMQIQARLGHWDAFDHELAELRQAKRAGLDHQLDSSTGFLIDGFAAGGTHVQTVIFPLQSDQYHTLYRFLLPKESPAKTSIEAGVNSGDAAGNGGSSDERCKNPEFRPYIDLESDDVDQAAFKQAHPEAVEKGERSYSLDTYPGPCSQGLIKFYNEGEPKYEAVRADIVKALTGAPKAANPNPETPSSTTPPEAKPETPPATPPSSI